MFGIMCIFLCLFLTKKKLFTLYYFTFTHHYPMGNKKKSGESRCKSLCANGLERKLARKFSRFVPLFRTAANFHLFRVICVCVHRVNQ